MASWHPSQLELALAQAGQNGATIIANTDTHTGKWCKLVMTADTVFNALTGTGYSAAPSGTIAAGVVLEGYFTSIDLTSGALVAYIAEE